MSNSSLPKLRWHIIKTIWFKEIKDLLRDKITLIFILGMPFVIYPLTILLQSEATIATQSHKAQTIPKVVLYQQNPESFYQNFKSSFNEEDKLEVSEDSNLEVYQQLYEKLEAELQKDEPDFNKIVQTHQKAFDSRIQNKKIDAALFILPNPSNEQDWINHHLYIVYDNTENRSKLAYERLRKKCISYKKGLMQTRLDDHELESSFINPLPFRHFSIASTEKEVSNILGMVLPLLIVTCLVVSIFHPSLALTCSEKENKTLPTLLCTPIHHLELIFGKYLTLILLAFLGLSANASALSIMLIAGNVSELFGFMPSPMTFIYVILILIPLTLFYAALFLCFSILPKNYREGGNYLTPVFIIALAPAAVANLEFIELTPLIAITPISNVSLLLREILVGPVSPDLIFLCIFSNTIWTVGLLYTASMFFSREDILLNENLKFYDIFTLNRSAFPKPTPGTSTVLFLILFCCFFYFSSALQALLSSISNETLKTSLPLITTVIVQFVIIMGIPLLVSSYFRMDRKQVFSFQMPENKAWIAAILVGLTMPLIGVLSSQVMSPPEEFEKQMESAIFGDGDRSIIFLLFAIAVVPGLCEEIAFRGIILKGFLSRLSPKWSILLSSLFFGLLHLSIYRLMPTFCLGLILGYALYKTGSILITILMHALNNSVAIILFSFEKDLKEHGILENEQLMGSVVMMMFSALVVGLIVLKSCKPRTT